MFIWPEMSERCVCDMAGKANIKDLVAGHVFPGVPVDVTAARVQKYLDVLDAEPLEKSDTTVPAAAAATFALSTLLDQFDLPPGTLHPSQDVRVHHPLRLGAETSCVAKVTGQSHRGKMTIFTFEFSLISPPDTENVTVQGATMLLIPDSA
jgi:hypothetical protein